MSFSINATASAPSLGIGSLSYRFLVAAQNMFAGVELLSIDPSKAPIACAFLAGQTLECALKSYLAYDIMKHEGKTEEETVKELRSPDHNLDTLWENAVRRSLKLPCPKPVWLNPLNEGYQSPFYFRYPSKYNMMMLPPLASMSMGLKSIIDTVEKSV